MKEQLLKIAKSAEFRLRAGIEDVEKYKDDESWLADCLLDVTVIIRYELNKLGIIFE